MSCKHEHDSQTVCEACTFEPFVKNNYFTGKMMGAADFITETRYHSEKLRLHQARLHGWGVVCGLDVVPHPNASCRTRYVVVKPGSAVDCCGNDILVPEEEILDLLCYRKVADLAKENPARLHALGICVRFHECATENVPVLYDDCGCNDDGCAPNRILESYAFDVIVDPQLSRLKKVDPAQIAGAVFMRPPATGLAANTPRIGTAVIVGTTLYALDAKNAQKLIVYDLLSRHGMTLDLGADAFGIAGNAQFVFVATAPKSGGSTPMVQVFQPGGTGALMTLDSGTAAANTLAVGVSSDPSRAAILYVKETGDLLAFAPDATNGLVGPAAALGTIAANLLSFLVVPDGSMAYAIDTGGAKVKAITFATANVADLDVSLSGASPSALAYWESGGKKLLAVGSETAKTLNIIDLGVVSTLLASLTLDHPPEFVTVAPADLVQVIEEDGSAIYLQTIDAAPLPSDRAAVVGAPRMIDGMAERIVAFTQAAEAGVLTDSDQADLLCDELVWHQRCSACDMANCVTLATIERYQAGAAVLVAEPAAALADDIAKKQARIDNREGRKVLASSETLQAWIECLELKGAPGQNGKDGKDGAPGKDGLGFNPNLPKIIDIGWKLEDKVPIQDFVLAYRNILTQPDPKTAAQKAILARQGVPPLTIYFNKEMTGVTRRTFSVSFAMPLPTPGVNGGLSAAVYLPIDLRMYGDIVGVTGSIPTPHTGETALYAASFLPRLEFFTQPNGQLGWPIYVLLAIGEIAGRSETLDLPQCIVALKGDFVVANGLAIDAGVLDGDNIGGKVGEATYTRPGPITGGKNPSGNLDEGGLFESWFFLSGLRAEAGSTAGPINQDEVLSIFNPSRFGMTGAPPAMNFSSASDIAEATGISQGLADRIVRERATRPFTSGQDLKTRLNISNGDWKRLQPKLLML
jgi:hypothetical protein